MSPDVSREPGQAKSELREFFAQIETQEAVPNKGGVSLEEIVEIVRADREGAH